MRYQIRHARVQFGGDVILQDVNFEVHDREKIAIVGRNGCGKTTLLKLIAGDIEMSNPDSDEECGITMAGGQEIGFLRQVNFVDAEVTVEDELKKVFVPVFACEERMKELEEQMKTAAETKETAPDGALLREYDRLQKQMEAMRGYSWRRDMETMFQRFGFALEDLRRPIGSFSGGQQTKVAFIKLLLTRPDIMLLDEPTNHLDLPDVQQTLLKALVATGKPVVLVLFTGRPLVLNWEQANVPAILNVWFGGSEAAYAIGDVLFGRVNPSGKLTMSFPQNVGQIPLYYAHKNTGRPLHDGKWFEKFRSNYLDVTNEPLYPFGFGLSYTTFAYSDISLSQTSMNMQGVLTASVNVTNTGAFPGGEVVQLYIRDLVGSTTRPVKELKGFERIYLQPGQTRTVTFKIAPEMLKFYNYDLQYVVEPGDFSIMIGPNSRDVQTASIRLIDS